MKKLMILGGGPNQIPLIKAAKKTGYYVVLCDYSDSAPGVALADELCLVSIMDKEGVLQATREKQVDGVISNSEPAMPIVAYVGNALDLPSNDYATVAAMTNKYAFRSLLKEKGFAVPDFGMAKTFSEAEALFHRLRKPVMVKPAASSGSRGVVKVSDLALLKEVFDEAQRYSRNDLVILEEYIDNTCGRLVAGDIFISQEQVVFWGIMDSLRGTDYPLNPIGEWYPAALSDEQRGLIKNELNRAAKALHITFSAINIEVVIGPDGNVYFIELNPRNGGNRIPEALLYATGFDIFDATVRAAIGETVPPYSAEHEGVTATYMVHADARGTLKNISFSDELKPFIRDYFPDVEAGAEVEPFVNSDKRLGVLVMQFDSVSQRNYMMSHIKEHVHIELT